MTAEQALDGYLNAEKCADRLKFIVSPDKNKAALAEAYKGQSTCVSKHTGTPDVSSCSTTKVGEYCDDAIQVAMVDEPVWYCMKREESGFKIDWRCSKQYNPTSLAAFKVERSKDPTRFRLTAKLDSYFNYEYAGLKETFYSIELRDENNEMIHGYIRREAATAGDLFKVLKDGKSHAITVTLRFPVQHTESPDCLLDSFVGNGWREKPEEFEPSPAPVAPSTSPASAPASKGATPVATTSQPKGGASPMTDTRF